MSRYDYQQSQDIAAKGYSFFALLMALMRKADDDNLELLKTVFPSVWMELKKRYNAPNGILKGD